MDAVRALHVLSHLPVSQREVGRYLERRVRAGGRVLAAVGVPPELPDLMERLGRISSARFVRLRPPTAREMVRIVVILAARSGIPVEADVARAIAARCRGDVRLAQGAIARLRLAKSLTG